LIDKLTHAPPNGFWIHDLTLHSFLLGEGFIWARAY